MADCMLREGRTVMQFRGFKHRIGLNFFGALPNYHTDMEVMILLAGEVNFRCNAEMISLRPGDICFVTPGTLHMMEYAENIETLTFMIDAKDDVLSSLPENARYLSGNIEEYLSFFHETLKLLEGEETFTYAQTREFARSVLHSWCSILTEWFWDHKNSFCCFNQNDQAKEIFSYITGNSKENISIDTLTSKYYISGSYLSRLFREYVNSSPMEALIRTRIFRASMDLITTEEPVGKIAERCGYSNLVAFQKAFVKRNACSPTEFRKKYKGRYKDYTFYYSF